jgi:hypothetical protein
MWKGTVLMISFAGLGEGSAGEGEVSGVGESAGVGAVLGVVITDGVASGELVASWLGWVHAARMRTTPAISVAGTTPHLRML